ncbi:hypothetical protein QVD17_02072 [Tagetes erecta]|uniref:Hydrophobic seed protein domain-containing protein n=1 Tax=Tagetes erecta TaxID=13708 RepID=A0AAD8P7F1_TARER|nr:hypothetical protein QVD17_02072 [Tagetes erecta]
MALKTIAFFLTINILFFSLVSSQTTVPAPEPAACPIQGEHFGACASVLNGWLNGVQIGSPSTTPCCSLFLGGLVNFDAAGCICRAIKASFLGVTINTSAAFSLMYDLCKQDIPAGLLEVKGMPTFASTIVMFDPTTVK